MPDAVTAMRAIVPAGWPIAGRPPYTPGIEAGGFVFVSGQLPVDPSTGEPVGGSVEQQTEQALRNLGAVLAEAGASFGDVVKVTVYLLRRSDWAAMNEAYRRVVGTPPPARCAVVVPEMAPGASVEIEAIALAPTRAAR
jgi:2-iminobutanoate/2-iminopropanoate deaminase